MAPDLVEQTDAYEVVRGGAGDAPLLLTCEHASNRLPAPWSWPEEDRWLVETHWAVDLGVGDLTRDLAAVLGATGVLARFSRLLVDANRSPRDADLCRAVADGREVALNRGIGAAEVSRRLAAYHQPFHDAIDRALTGRSGNLVLSMHSFTPVYEGGPPRPMELGVLFDEEEALALRCAEVLRGHGFVTALNEPWSGKGGLMFSPRGHAMRHGWRALEVEVRQDLAVDPRHRARIVAAVAAMARVAVQEPSV